MKPYKAPIPFAGHIPGDTIAARLRVLRLNKAMSVKEFCEFTGLTIRQLTAIEDGKQNTTANKPHIDEIARKCGVQPVWLYAGSDVPQRFWPVWWNPETPTLDLKS